MPAMKDEQIEPSVWSHYRGEVEQVLSKQLDEESWHVLQSLPVAVGPELLWRLRAFHPQLAVAGGTISFHPIRSLPPPEQKTRSVRSAVIHSPGF